MSPANENPPSLKSMKDFPPLIHTESSTVSNEDDDKFQQLLNEQLLSMTLKSVFEEKNKETNNNLEVCRQDSVVKCTRSKSQYWENWKFLGKFFT